MRRLFPLLLFSFCCTAALSGADPYQVRAASGLNVRSAPGLLAQVVGSLPNRDTVYVEEIADHWARIEYRGETAWVSAQFLLPAGTKAAGETGEVSFSADKKNVLIAVVILSGLLWFLQAVRKRWEQAPAGLLWSGLILFGLLCGLEIYHVIGLSGGLWFCTPDVVGWGVAILNSVLLAFVFFTQYRVFLTLLLDMQYRARQKVDYRTGIYSYLAAVVAAVAAGLFLPEYTVWIVRLLLAAQLVQLVIIVVKTRRTPLYCLLSLATYLAGSVATLLVMVHFLVVALVVMVILLIISIGGRIVGEGTSRKTYIYYR